MGENKIYIINLAFGLIPVYAILNFLLKEKKKREEAILQAYIHVNSNIIFGIMWFVFFFIWIWLFIDSFRDVSFLLKEKYTNNVFQLFDFQYLRKMNSYFQNKDLFMESIEISFYRSSLAKHITWINISVGNGVINILRGIQKNTIWENGLFIDNKFLKWKEIDGYEWGEHKEKKWLNRTINYDELYIRIKNGKLDAKILNEDAKQVTLHIKHRDKDLADGILKNENILNE